MFALSYRAMTATAMRQMTSAKVTPSAMLPMPITPIAPAHQLPTLQVIGDWTHFRDVFLNGSYISFHLSDAINELIHALMHRCPACDRLHF